MLTPITINFILFAFGVIAGAYLPLALIYLVSFFRREHFAFILIWKAAVRLAVIILLFVLISGALGFGLERLAPKGVTDEGGTFLAVGFLASFLVGIILFTIGLVRGRSRVVTGSGA